jgi:uncharacterized protein (TIGR03067 family)
MNKKLVSNSVVLAVTSFVLISTCAPAAESGFVNLCNGRDLSGWNGNPRLWSVQDGVITGKTTADNPLKGNTFLIWTNGTVGDFELRLSYKIVPNNDAGFANSGVQYRSKVLDPANWVVGGYQADMEAGDKFTGILYEERMTRGIMAERGEKVVWGKDCKKEVVGSLGKSEDLQAAIKKGDWNQYVVIAQGSHLQHFVNGKQTVDVVDDCEAQRVASGVLALQLHAGQPMTVQFKDIQLKQSGSSASADGELKRLQGQWAVEALETRGEAVTDQDILSMIVTITGNKYKITNSERTDSGTFSVDSSKKPAQMDIEPREGHDAGSKLPAIYEFDGDKLKICYGPEGERPTAFSTSNDSGRILVTYKRK